MKGYIYTMYAGADPSVGWVMNDPIFSKTPTLGACVPHIRRAVSVGDHIFVISGRVPGQKQFVVGEFEVAEKINALAAHRRFPQNRLRPHESGQVLGNIIIDGRGKHHPLDDHNNFESRIENYIVGRHPIVLETPAQFGSAKEETIDVLSAVFKKKGDRVFDIIGRYRKMDESQVEQVRAWLKRLAE
jgi:hypothetical protein